MSLPEMNIGIARTVARDAGDKSMRKAGRTVWNENDFNAAIETLDRICEQFGINDPWHGAGFGQVPLLA